MSTTNESQSQQIISELEALLTQPSEPTQDQIESAHTRASNAIRDLNHRLSNVHQLIVAGRRSEAIELAEGPPHVLDEVVDFDSQLIRDWEHWTGQFGLPRFMPLRSDLASVINGAYTIESRLENTMRRYRLLSIGRASLKQRQAVLSRLASEDPDHPRWKESLQECQRLRLEQLANRTKEAVGKKDLRCLQHIQHEVRSTKWLVPVNGAIRKTLPGAIQKLQSEESTAEAWALAEHLRDAYECGDVDRVEEIASRWRQIIKSVDRSKLQEELQSVDPILLWYDETKEQQRVEAAEIQANEIATRSLQTATSSDDLRESIGQIEKTGASIPAPLLDELVAKEKADRKLRKTKAIATAAIAGLVLFAATLGIAALVRAQRTEANRAKLADDITTVLDQNKLEDAEKLLAVAPKEDSRFEPLKKRLADYQLAKKNREDAFVAFRDQVLEMIKAAKTPLAFKTAGWEIDKLKDLAKTESEREDSARAQAQLNEGIARNEKEQEEKARELVMMIRRELPKLNDASEGTEKIASWKDALLSARTPWIAEKKSLLNDIEQTLNLMEDRRVKMRGSVLFERNLDRLSRHVGSWDEWMTAIRELDPPTESLQTKVDALLSCARQERPLWDAISLWNEIIREHKWTIAKVQTPHPDNAKNFFKDMDLVKRLKLSDLPAASVFLKLSDIGAPKLRRSSRELMYVTSMLRSSQMSSLGSIETKDGRWFYFELSEIRRKGDEFLVEHYIDTQLSSKSVETVVPISEVRIPDPSLFAESNEFDPGIFRVPHASLCSVLHSQLSQLQEIIGDLQSRLSKEPSLKDPWDGVFVRGYNDVIQTTNLDPLIQFTLVKKLLDTGSKGSWVVATAFRTHLQAIEQAEIDLAVNYLAPDDASTRSNRAKSKELLESLAKLKPKDPRPLLANLSADKELSTIYVPIGWINQTSSGWKVETNSSNVAKPGTQVFTRLLGPEHPLTIPIGIYQDHEVKLSEEILKAGASSQSMRLGRPVWVSADSVDSDAELFQ